MDHATLSRGIIVHRQATAELVLGKGHREATLAELQGMKGQTVKSLGNMSTSAAAQGLNLGFSGSAKAVEYRIKIPGGTKGAGMWVGDSHINSLMGGQREFMMNRDTLYRVGNTKYDKSRKIFITELTYTGRAAHDYGKSGRVTTADVLDKRKIDTRIYR